MNLASLDSVPGINSKGVISKETFMTEDLTSVTKHRYFKCSYLLYFRGRITVALLHVLKLIC